MKKLISILTAAISVAAFGEYASIKLLGEQDVGVTAAKVELVSISSTDADAAVGIYAVRTVQSFTNATDVTSVTVTNIVYTPSEIGVYSSEPFVYTNSTGNTYVRKGGTDNLTYTHVTNDLYRFVYTNGTRVATNTVHGTNTVFVGGRSFDFTTIKQTPSVSTNIVTTYTTNVTAVLKATAFVTNTILAASCAEGKLAVAPTNAFLCAGERLITTGLDVDGETIDARLIIIK